MTKTPPAIIAIDGPAASGKSTLGRRLADALGYLFFDTGVMYRAVTWLALQAGTDVNNEAAITALAMSTQIEVLPASKPDGRVCDVIVEGRDITWAIRDSDVDANVSKVSTYRDVRRALTEQQRRIGLRGKVVMVGRDIGTVVLPEAKLKIYLDASVRERATRRYNEIKSRGNELEYDDILDKVHQRDQIDSNREVAPLRAAQDAVVIDSDKLNADEVFEQARRLCE
jgi:cytidylate kinase